MKFRVERTSSLFRRTPRPCAGAKLLNPDAPEWESSVWEVELNTFEEFVEFVKENGALVVSHDEREQSDYRGTTIEIYDTYRE